MKKSLIIFSIITVAGCIVTHILTKASERAHSDLVHEFINLRDRCEEKCDLINSAAREMVANPQLDAEKYFNNVVSRGIDFTTNRFRSTINPDADDLTKIHFDLLATLASGMKYAISMADEHLASIEEARLAMHVAQSKSK